MPATCSPFLNRAMKASSDHRPIGLVAGSGVRLGVTKTLVGSAATSMRCPPAKAGPTSAPSSPRSVWHATHDDTLLARYAPRSTVAPVGLDRGAGAGRGRLDGERHQRLAEQRQPVLRHRVRRRAGRDADTR